MFSKNFVSILSPLVSLSLALLHWLSPFKSSCVSNVNVFVCIVHVEKNNIIKLYNAVFSSCYYFVGCSLKTQLSSYFVLLRLSSYFVSLPAVHCFSSPSILYTHIMLLLLCIKPLLCTSLYLYPFFHTHTSFYMLTLPLLDCLPA